MNTKYLNDARNMMRNLRELCVQVAVHGADTHKLKCYRNAIELEQEIDQHLEKNGKVGCGSDTIRKPNQVSEPVTINIVINTSDAK